MKYEVIREIFNSCSGNQMRDVFVDELEIPDINAYMDRYRVGGEIEEDIDVASDGSIIYNLTVDGIRQRVTFSEI